MFVFFQCWFLERHPWNKDGTLKFMSPSAYLTVFYMWFQVRFCELLNAKFSSTKGNSMACFFEKAKTSVTIYRRNKVIPCPTLTCIKAATIRPATSYSGLSKSSTLKRGASILLKYFHCFFFAVPFPLFLLSSFSILYFCLSSFISFMTSLTVNSLPMDWSCTRWYTKRF